ncbi:MAG: hypothetical protein CMH31_02650 [Micavibrio sp.]|nr:hypothetical protein [Micavibrio sp.]
MELVRPCQLCPHMKRITLPKILEALQTESPEVLIDDKLAERAVIPVQKMLNLS